MRVAPLVELTDEQERALQQWARGRTFVYTTTQLGETVKQACRSTIVLLVSPSEKDRSDLAPICTRFGRAHVARTRAELAAAEVGIVICEANLPDGSWKDVLELCQDRPVPPYLIVASQVADESLWAAVLNLGGCGGPSCQTCGSALGECGRDDLLCRIRGKDTKRNFKRAKQLRRSRANGSGAGATAGLTPHRVNTWA